jgi:hypothetical protein
MFQLYINLNIRKSWDFFLLVTGKLHMHAKGFELTTLPSTLLLQEEEVSFKLDLIGRKS